MKIKNYITTFCAFTALSVLSTARSQTWETSDTVMYPAAGPSAQVDDIASAPDGTLYAIGASIGLTGGFGANWVRRSLDAGATWESVISFSPVSGNGINKLAVDTSGVLYAAGLFNGVWTVLRLDDHGQSWTTVDSFSGAGSWPELRDMATDANGAVYVVGSGTPARGPRQWIVRKGVPGVSGITWNTVDVYTVDKTHGAFATSVALKSSGSSVEILVGGKVQSSSGLNWLVRRSTNGGASWSVSDTLASGIDGVQTLAIAPDGNIYTSGAIQTIGGTKKNPTTTKSFVVRKGVATDGAIAWSTQQVVPQTALTSEFRPQSSAVDPWGRIFFAGYDVTRGTEYSWNYQVRVSTDGGQTLADTDSFEGVAFCVATDPIGNVYTGGYFGSGLPDAGGIIRKLAAPVE